MAGKALARAKNASPSTPVMRDSNVMPRSASKPPFFLMAAYTENVRARAQEIQIMPPWMITYEATPVHASPRAIFCMTVMRSPNRNTPNNTVNRGQR